MESHSKFHGSKPPTRHLARLNHDFPMGHHLIVTSFHILAPARPTAQLSQPSSPELCRMPPVGPRRWLLAAFDPVASGKPTVWEVENHYLNR